MAEKKPLVTYNRATQRKNLPNLNEVWTRRHLIKQLVMRDFKVRYTQSILGVLWVIISPIVTMIVYTFVFDRLTDVPTYDIPYPVFSFAALVPWNYFTSGVSSGSSSLLANRQLITDVYIPRFIIPIVTQFTGLIDMFINFGVFLVLMLVFGILPSVNIILLPLFTIQLLILSVGISFFLSALKVRFRDIGQLVGYGLQILVFLSPVAYPSEIVDGTLGVLYNLNPMVGILDGWRWAILGIDTLTLQTSVISVSMTLGIFVVGLWFFTRSEPSFVDWM